MEQPTNKLAEFFNKQRDLIEAAETPFAKLAVFILPILSPMVPATLTGMHLYQLFLELFTFDGAKAFAIIASVIPAVVLELLGYVGAISFIQALFKWIESRGYDDADKFLVPAILNFLAYIFYLAAMWLINVSLGRYFQTPEIVNSIVGLLSFITVPTSLLAANHLAMKEHDAKEETVRKDKNTFKLQKEMLKHGINPLEQKVTQYQSATTATVGTPKKGDWRLLTRQERHEVKHVLSPKEIMQKYPVSKATAYNWKDDTKYKLDD